VGKECGTKWKKLKGISSYGAIKINSPEIIIIIIIIHSVDLLDQLRNWCEILVGGGVCHTL